MFQHIGHGDEAETRRCVLGCLERLAGHWNTELLSGELRGCAVQLQPFSRKSTLFEQVREEACAATDVQRATARPQLRRNPVDIRLELGTERRARVLHGEQLVMVAIAGVKAHDVIERRVWVSEVLLAAVATGEMPLARSSAAEEPYGR